MDPITEMAQELLQEASLVDNFTQLNELLFDQTSRFVQDYKVLTEVANEKSYRVVVQATVSGAYNGATEGYDGL